MEEITIEDFGRIELKIGTIRAAEAHPDADRLLVLSVDLGEERERQIVAGIRAAYDVRSLVGQQVVVVANLKSTRLRGIESCGMLLAAGAGADIALVAPTKRIDPGTPVK